VFIDLALKGKPLVIHGDGMQTRSFTYVSDSVRGVMTVLNAGRTAVDGELFNIGTDEEITIADLGRMVYRLVRPQEEPVLEFVPYNDIAGKPYEDVRRRVPNAEKLKRLGWQPTYSLRAGLEETVAWQRQLRSGDAA
jgi:UDP-glucose 4-epimerase